MSETIAALDQLTTAERLRTWEDEGDKLKTRIATIIGNRTLAVVNADSSFDPDLYDPAFDDVEYTQVAA
jgi:hypothetical protein